MDFKKAHFSWSFSLTVNIIKAVLKYFSAIHTFFDISCFFTTTKNLFYLKLMTYKQYVTFWLVCLLIG